MKPVKEEKLRSVLDRAVEKLTKNERVLHFEAGGEWCVCRFIRFDMQMCSATM